MSIEYIETGISQDCEVCNDITPMSIFVKNNSFNVCKSCALELADQIKDEIGDE